MKKGFTLIELLAVIVILAIISLIAVPIVIHIINDSKTSSEEQSVELYIDTVKKAIARKQLENSSFNPSTCTIENNGNILCGNEEIIVDMKGIKPNKGIIEIKDNKVTYKNLLLNGKYYNKITELILDNNNNGEPDIGDQYKYKVNEKDTFNFYVLSFNEEDTVNLIMDRNICGSVTDENANMNGQPATAEKTCLIAWNSTNNNNYGPVTAMQGIYNATKEWINVPNIDLSDENVYTDENNTSDSTKGYTGITTSGVVTTIIGTNGATNTTIGTNKKPLKARLPKEREVYPIDNSLCTGGLGTCPAWLVENLADTDFTKYTSTKKISGIKGYWLLSSHPGRSDLVHDLRYDGSVGGDYANNIVLNGIRPVITVPRDYLE